MQKIVQNTPRIFFKLFHSSSRLWLAYRMSQEFWLVQRWRTFQLFHIQMPSIRTISRIFPGQCMTHTQKSKFRIGCFIRANPIAVFSSPDSWQLRLTLLMNKWKIKRSKKIKSTNPIHCSLMITFSKYWIDRFWSEKCHHYKIWLVLAQKRVAMTRSDSMSLTSHVPQLARG